MVECLTIRPTEGCWELMVDPGEPSVRGGSSPRNARSRMGAGGCVPCVREPKVHRLDAVPSQRSCSYALGLAMSLGQFEVCSAYLLGIGRCKQMRRYVWFCLTHR